MQDVRRRAAQAAMWSAAAMLALIISIPPAAAEGDASARDRDGDSPSALRGWVRTGALDAAEAHQAAAADDQRVYAINNTHVAAYDPQTGRRIALSEGAAQHLNSGFLWEGRLYCAHSNFPRVPELSMIKVLDLATMRLETFKDFGASQGSLTWAVREAGDWWCNFAYYGDRNHLTTLVRFDDSWQQRGRWTYPARLVDQLGNHSLSGGIWRDGHLLVTGHDHRIIYRLRLPNEGDQLAYVDQMPAPFTGQGFAADPRSGGLIGIDRARRQLIFAEAADQIAASR